MDLVSRKVRFRGRSFARLTLVFALSVGVPLFYAAPAKSSGTIYAVITLTNGTSAALTLSKPGTSTVWGISPPWLTYLAGLVMLSNGSPPAMLGPGSAMVWGSASNGGPLATTGTGGSVVINEANVTLTWSVPWTAENIGPPFPGCNYSIKSNGSSTFVTAVIANLGVGNAWGTATPDNKTCEFDFVATPPP